MLFEHLCGNACFTIEERNYAQYNAAKPDGLWLSVVNSNPDWRQWCLDNEYSTVRSDTVFCYNISVDFTNILLINSFEELSLFSKLYSTMKGYSVN